MRNNYYLITKKDLFDLFGRLCGANRLVVPYAKGERIYFDVFDPAREDRIELGGIRQSQPVKAFLNPARERIPNGAPEVQKPLIIAGVKGCDLSSLALQDFVFLEGENEDPFYAESRKRALIISCDCAYARQTCFCVAMDGAPYPREYFDINLSCIDDDFLVEAATEKGKALVAGYRMFFRDAPGRHADIRKYNRAQVTEQVKTYIAKKGTPGASQIKGVVAKNYNLTGLWQDFASTCVECGACNLVCPTCHCFLLFDEQDAGGLKKRYREWDACLYKTFARVAGGANPRKHLYERLRNRFEKKFDFFPKVMNYFACTGCGRCVEACPGKIDIREVLKGLVLGKWNKPPND